MSSDASGSGDASGSSDASGKGLIAKLMPRYVVPPLPALSDREKLALLIGTGLGSGFMKPMAPSWASIPGFFLFAIASRISVWAAVVIFAAMLWPAVWSGTICERLLRKKDPRPVVIDEIAAVPFALWPLWIHWPVHWVSWAVLFAIYRVADFLKPWPANSLQSVKGGLGILIDDLISSAYMGVALYLFMRFFPGVV
jgi:phosphatidylglycerophosphatase A